MLAARIMVPLGFAAVIVGGVDAMEGVFLIAPGSVMLAFGALLGGTHHRRIAYVSVALILLSFALLLGLSALGGFGGKAPLLRSNWWGLLLVPYPVGWMMSVAGGAVALTSLFSGLLGRAVAGAGLLAAAVLLGRIAALRLVPLWVAGLEVALGLIAIFLVYRSEKTRS